MLGQRIHTGSVNDLVKPWIDILSTHADRVPPTPPVKEPEAYIKWGKASAFTYEGDFRTDATTGFQVTNPGAPPRKRYSLDEEGRAYTDFKVTSPNDPDSYVIVRRVDEIAFDGPGGAQWTLVLAPDTIGTKEGSGQIPETPPLDQL